MKVVNKYGNFAFVDIEVNAGAFAKFINEVEKDDHVLHRAGDDSSAILVPLASEL